MSYFKYPIYKKLLEELIDRLRAEIRDKDGIIEEKNEQIKKLQGQSCT